MNTHSCCTDPVPAMQRSHKLLIFLSAFSLGLILPVQSLLLLAHGCTLRTLGFAIGAFAAAVILAEVPTGIFADLYGRKVSFLVACTLYILSCLLLLGSSAFVPALAGLFLSGLGVAFSSGSLDALVVEEAGSRYGENATGRIVGTLRALEGAGLMAGALAGGLLPSAGGYRLHLLIRLAVSAGAGLTAYIVLKESRAPTERTKLRTHLTGMFRIFRTRPALLPLIGGIAVIGVGQFLLETYWQPHLSDLSGSASNMLLGLLCAGGFGVIAGGSALAGRIRIRRSDRYWTVYIAAALGFALLLGLLSVPISILGFSAVYLAMYLMIGIITVAEQTITNGQVTDAVRASVLSLTSFTARAGGIVGSAAGAFLIAGGSIEFVWRTGAVITAAGLAMVSLMHRVRLRMH